MRYEVHYDLCWGPNREVWTGDEHYFAYDKPPLCYRSAGSPTK